MMTASIERDRIGGIMKITALDLIDLIDSSCKEVRPEHVEVKFKLNGNGGVFRFSLRRKRKPESKLTHDLIIYNQTEKEEHISCPECGGVVVSGCSGYCSRCYNRFTNKGALGL